MHFKLQEKATKDNYVHVEIRKGMYGLPQVGLLEQLLETCLNKYGYHQSKKTPGLWTHKMKPIQYIWEKHANLLIMVLKQH